MAELRPYPFAALIHRMFEEFDVRGTIFDLPSRKFYTGATDKDFTVTFAGHRASSPLGPAAGPQSQMAQNLVLSYLVGCRVFELKTVQILDELQIPRPCIDMQTVGYNVEWSQELSLEQSVEEYVKGSMLIQILEASGKVPVIPGFEHVVYDMSVGYDLTGIRSDAVQRFIHTMMDATPVVERLRGQIPERYARYRELDFRTRLSDSLTLSTFHGCPPEEIEQIIAFLLDDIGLHCIVKLNPTLLGPQRVTELVRDTMGYADLRTPPTAFEQDTSWEQAMGFVERLGQRAQAKGLGFGVKFSNTLIVDNHRHFFPASEAQMYLSGPPLHVLAINLVDQHRRHFGDRFPVSFSAGIDRRNYADAVALGLVPITVCSDLLKPGGYGRAQSYHQELVRRMNEVGAAHVDAFVLRAYGMGRQAIDDCLDPPLRQSCGAAWEAGTDLRDVLSPNEYQAIVSRARLLNTERYAQSVCQDPRYRQPNNAKLPKKVGSHLVLFDCLTCDKCIPVCPNDANFAFTLPTGDVPVVLLRRDQGHWRTEQRDPISIGKKHQIANYADFCNECGNCDIFCPEDGGPYVVKPRFFGSRADFDRFADHDGFFVRRQGPTREVHGRFGGKSFYAAITPPMARFTGPGFAVTLNMNDPSGTAVSDAGEIDLTHLLIMDLVSASVLNDPTNYVGALAALQGPHPVP